MNHFVSVVRRRLIAGLATLVVLAATCALVSGGDLQAAGTLLRPEIATVTVNGVHVRARNGGESTVALCPRDTTIAARLRDRRTKLPKGRSDYAVYWQSARSPEWHDQRGTTGPAGRIHPVHLARRLSAFEVSGDGFSHVFHVRYRRCAATVSDITTSTPYGVRGERRPYVRVTGTLHAQRSDGTTRVFGGGRVVVRDARSTKVLTTRQTSADGTFAAVVPVTASTRLAITPVAGPGVSTAHPVSYGRTWRLRTALSAHIAVPAWMRRHVRYTPSVSFSPRLDRYTGNFADPTVIRVGKRYYAAATTSSNLNLPVLTSTNLQAWRPREALPNYYDYTSWPHYNDALPSAPRWAARTHTRENVKRISQWAPSLARLGKHRYLAAFSAATRATAGQHRHSCIGLAVASGPAGPYRPLARPLLCDPTTFFGVIDPNIFVDPRTHHVYLTWAAEGIPHHRKGRLAMRRLNDRGTGWARGSRRHDLLTFTQRWESVIVENPSMIRYRGTLYLFYSANHFSTSRYATGYAICRTAAGPCTKARRGPLLASRGRIAGPGGASAFTDARGRLRLAYAAWQRGHVGTGGRRLHIATLARSTRHHTLSVRRMSQ
ncbi:MAG: glycoside hydrolase family 43 protein [Nocardioides sp.]